MCELQEISGFQKKIRNGIVFYKNSTIFYLAGQTGIFHSLKKNSQRFFTITNKNEFTAMALGTNYFLALASKGHTPKLMVYNLKSSETYTLKNPSNVNNRMEYVCVSFSGDNEYLAAQANFPSWPFFIWELEKRSFLGTFIPFRLEPGAKVYKFSFNPKDNSNIIAVGRYFLRIYQHRNGNRFKEEVFHELERSQKTFHSLTWLQEMNKFAVGTSDGVILIFERGQLLQQVIIDKKLAGVPRILDKIRNPENRNITCLLSCKTGLLCSYGGNSVLCLEWKVDKKDFNIISSVQVPKPEECNTEESKIVHLILNSNEDKIAASTDDGQILVYSFILPGLLECIGYEAEFDVISDRQHKTPIICADAAVNRPVHVTCSKSTLILWNYQKRKLVLWEKFKDEIRSVSIHPLGIILSIGFPEGCKVYNILYNKLEEIKHFETNSNLQIRFAEGGHMIALANVSAVELYFTLSFEKCVSFLGHDGEIKCMLWKNNDNRLLSLDESGKIYEWDVALKKKAWYFYENDIVFSTLAISDVFICAATLDSKIWMFENYQKISEIDVQMKMTSLLIAQNMLLGGTESGMVYSLKLHLNGDTLLESCNHQGAIVHMTIKENGRLLLVTGEDGCISMWKMAGEPEKSIPLFDEVLIEEELYESKVNMIAQLEKDLQEKIAASDAKEEQQLKLQETEKTELLEHYENIENQLRQTIITLTEENYNLQIDMEKTQLENIAAICKERDENYLDFQSKLQDEEEHFKKLAEERENSIEAYEWQLCNLKEEIKASNERVEAVKKKNETRLKELESVLQKELDNRQKTVKKDEDFYKSLEEKAKALSEETNSKFTFDLEKARFQNECMTSEVERLSAMLDYEKECDRTLDAEFGKKKLMYDNLKKTTKYVKMRINQLQNDIQRKESELEDKASMVRVLEEDAKEMEHLSSEADWKLEECKKTLEGKSEKFSQLSIELEKLENEHKHLTKKLKLKQREQFVLDEKLKSTEKSIADSTQKLLKSQLLLERYRKEFIDSTKDTESPLALRWALLTLLDKRILRGRIKEEQVFVGDTDPLMKFCRERDHYESLINTVLNRSEEVQSSFRSTYIRLAKENSDWTAFAEFLLSDLKQKQEKIEILEAAVGLPAKDFLKDPSETQKRFNNTYEDLKQIETERNLEIQKRMDLVEIQTKELQRLHGLLVVEERGKIVRKIGH